MSPGEQSRCLAECRVFARYLSGAEPSQYVLNCYERMWASATRFTEGDHSLIERSLLRLARAGTLLTRIADGYARVFRPAALLRRRLILLLAILENSPPTAAELTAATAGSRMALVLRMAASMLASAGCLLVGIVLLGPLQLASLPRRGPG